MPTWPCPECGARKGEAHKTSCSHAQVRRRPGFGKGIGHRHTPKKVPGREGKDGTNYWYCSKCMRKLGRW